MHSYCIRCGKWFQIPKELELLIKGSYIDPLDVILCPECAEAEEDQAEYEEELQTILNEL